MFGGNPTAPLHGTTQTTAGVSTGTRRVGRRNARAHFGVLGRPYADGELYFQADSSQAWGKSSQTKRSWSYCN